MSGKHYPSLTDILATEEEALRTKHLEEVLSNPSSDGNCLLVVYDFVNKKKVCSRFI